MHVLLVGNGFDLHHMFPTSYINFLHTVCFLCENYDESFCTVGKVFGNEKLQEADSFIKECYHTHMYAYDTTTLPHEQVEKIIELARGNLWFKYLCNCIKKDIRWIDFEKEIARVIKAFSEFIFNDKPLDMSNDRVFFDFSSYVEDEEDQHILEQFKFFFDFSKNHPTLPIRTAYVKPQYIAEKVVGSNVFYTDDDLIVSVLYESLTVLSEILRLYFVVFVDEPTKAIRSLGINPNWQNVVFTSRVYSFNYTKTFEFLYGNNMVDHIHGSTMDKIVLGINPDEHDELEEINTTFLQFKKYFQRIFYKTDLEYLRNIKVCSADPRITGFDLTVIGHSLDVTDKDIIIQIFEAANSITILYHREASVKNLIKNLVSIYGKRGLDALREGKNLQFVPQNKIEWLKPHK